MVPSVEILAGDPGLVSADGSPPPMRVVKLGRVKSRMKRNMPRMQDYFAPTGRPLPPGISYSDKGIQSIRQVYGNDQEGDCVIAGKLHMLGVWSGNDTGTPLLGSTREALSEYHRICGSGDNGCYIPAVLDEMVRGGLLIGGTKHKIDGYAQLDTSNVELVKAVTIALGGFTIGFNVPAEWMGSGTYEGAVWDNPSSYRFVGGHDVRIVGYDSRGVQLATWGLIVTMTWAALTNPRIVDEGFAELGKDWYNDDLLAPSGFDVAALKVAIDKVNAGNVPPWEPEPAPTPPPVPPVPPVPPTPPVHQHVIIPDQIMHVLGFLPVTYKGGMYVVQDMAGGPVGDHANWIQIGKDVAQLALDAFSQNWAAVPADFMKILQDLHILGVRVSMTLNQTASLQVPWFTLVMDFLALGRAVYARDIPGVIAALEKLAKDLGLVIPFTPANYA